MSWSKVQCGSFWWSHDWNPFCHSSSEGSVCSTSPKHMKCSAWPKCLPMLCKILTMCAYRDDLAIAQRGEFNIVISIAHELCNSNVQGVSMSIMTPQQTGAISQPKLMLYSLFIWPPKPLFKLHHPDIMLHTRNAHLLSNPSDHAARGVPAQDGLARTPLWSMMMKVFPSRNGNRDPKQAERKESAQLALSSPVTIFPPPLLGHHMIVTSLLEWSEVIIWPMKEGNGERTFKLGPIVTHGIQTPKKPRGNPLQAQVAPDEPSKHDEPPIPGPSSSSEPPEDIPTCEPEPEVAPTQYTEEPFGNSPLLFLYSYQLFLTPPLNISSLSCYSALVPPRTAPPPPLIPTMTLARNLPTLIIPQAMIHKSINQILWEHCCLLHMIPFMDAAH
ncbi:hypothetical protein O181_027793 [Austropuccinia psidii MF-1]|uniref:Uncharacterized protein n=1 Tax=Austropuccinia psidii MF-1 TaxID=1389203 RepID=A0A9Q3H185_9BASI|nr:hypothetical protein [Austropuccinia psidii MF-1]